MKIGFDAKRLFRNHTGLGNYSRTMVSNLHRFEPANDYFLLADKISATDETQEFLDGGYHIVSPAKSRKTWRLRGCVKDVKRLELDIYHGLSHDLPFGIEHSGARSVVTIHDVCYKTFPRMFPLVERLMYGVKYRHSIKVANKIIAISESTKRDILKYFDVDPARVVVIYQALNPVFYEPTDLATAREVVSRYGLHGSYMLFVGSLNERKNLLSVLRAYAAIDRADRLPLVVIGNGNGRYAQQCMAAILDLGIENDVVRIENLSSMGVLRDFYTLAKFLVYPSFYEGFGLPVAEAALCGCPVITSRVSSLPEAGGPYAEYVDADSVPQIAQAMCKLLSYSDEERAAHGCRANEWVRSAFDPQRLTGAVRALYDEVLATTDA
ncbi:MAG: glycosyltransferase family 1 protein [Mucinivorans sp.]